MRFLALLLCTLPACAQYDPTWDVTPPPRLLDRLNLLPSSPALVKSLGDAAEHTLRFQPPLTAAAWRARRPQVEQALRQAIGLTTTTLPPRTPLNARITATRAFATHDIDNLTFDSRPGFSVTANLYRPKSSTAIRRPAIVSPIGHYLSAGKTVTEVQALAIGLAQLGFLVLTYDAIGHGERMLAGNIHHEAGYALLPLGETIAGWMVWDTMRAIDYLLTRSDVDPARIGLTGNSGGGLNTLYAAALDSRVHAAAIAGFTFEFNNWIKYAGAHCTCTHIPGLFRTAEWFEIAALIAPRPLLMLQGSNDNIFPISGARRAGHNTELVYKLTGQPDKARFVEIPNQPHAYSKPYREVMYGFMKQQLMGQGSGHSFPEPAIETLPEQDPSLLAGLPASQTVVQLARTRALAALPKLPAPTLQSFLDQLTAPPEVPLHFLGPVVHSRTTNRKAILEKLSFLAEDGSYTPALLWLPTAPRTPPATVLIVHELGKSAIAQSGFVEPLLAQGFAVFAPDLRGRGETLSHIRVGYTTGFRLLANQTTFGQPLAGRRAFDLRRAIDYLQTRPQLGSNITAVGIGDDALPVLLAAATDPRIRAVAVSRFYHSFISPMRPMKPYPRPQMGNAWNNAQLTGHIDSGDYPVDLSSVIPFILRHGDIADIAALLRRPLLFCDARDHFEPDAQPLRARFQDLVGKNIHYTPEHPLSAELLLEFLARNAR